MATQFDVSPEQKKIIEEKVKRRLVLREQFLKEASDPFRHASGEGGAVFDPALQRFMAMRVSTYEHFRPTSKNLLMGWLAIGVPMFGFGYLLKTSRDKKEAAYRRGEVAYKDRFFKFI